MGRRVLREIFSFGTATGITLTRDKENCAGDWKRDKTKFRKKVEESFTSVKFPEKLMKILFFPTGSPSIRNSRAMARLPVFRCSTVAISSTRHDSESHIVFFAIVLCVQCVNVGAFHVVNERRKQKGEKECRYIEE